MSEMSVFALILVGFVLGLRHGIDWDHIAAIADITGTAVTPAKASTNASDQAHPVRMAALHPRSQTESRSGFLLATLYAVGHASVVVVLGLLAIRASTLLPDWVGPVMERVVGLTLLALGVWIFYSFWRHGRSFRLRSRWMLVFSLAGRGWAAVRARLTGQPSHHVHRPAQYGPRTAYAVGMLHGVGAETGSEALLLATAAGATTPESGTLMLLAFVAGLLISNSFVAAVSTFGFVSSKAKHDAYLVVGATAGVFSLVVGAFFVSGQGAALPDLQDVIDLLFGPPPLAS
ncbi:MAG: hypothetical protein GEU73_09055 [Chloroflexi bacterium]|nr:hypothetical protein [Chloroflexota bacterium]